MQRNERLLLTLVLPALLMLTNLPASAQLVGTATFNGQYGVAHDYTAQVSFDVGDFFTDTYERLFEDQRFFVWSEGETFEASINTESDFNAVVAVLTNGLEDDACLRVGGLASSASDCDTEQRQFGIAQTDFQGSEIRRITLELVQLDFSSDPDYIDVEAVIRLYADDPAEGPCTVNLLSPAPGVEMDNGCDDAANSRVWDFAWDACPGATDYNVVARGPTALVDIFDVVTTDTSYQDISGGYIADRNRLGWTWKVRARVAGVWGEFTESTFDVEPLNTDCSVPTQTVTWGAMKSRF